MGRERLLKCDDDMGMTQDIRLDAAEIQLSNLTKTFGDLKAVDDVSLHIRKSDFYTFLGPSGCGKTTLLRMIAGFVMPDAGDILFDGQRVTDTRPWRRGVGMVFQNFALWPHMSVFDNIAFGLRERKAPRHEIREKVHTALTLVDLEGLDDRRPSQLSGGQQQRVALARTLVVEPRALLLDEPLSSLDAKLRIQMRNELIRIQRDLGITTIYVTHDQEEALALSTQVAVFSKGRVIQQGTPKEIYESPRARGVASFVGTSNFLTGVVDRVDGAHVYLNVSGEGSLCAPWSASFDTPPDVGMTLLLTVRPESLQLVEPSDDGVVNRLQGTVLAATYLGASIQYDVETPSGVVLKVNVSNPRGLSVLDAGTSVHLTFAPEDAVLLLADG